MKALLLNTALSDILRDIGDESPNKLLHMPSEISGYSIGLASLISNNSLFRNNAGSTLQSINGGSRPLLWLTYFVTFVLLF